MKQILFALIIILFFTSCANVEKIDTCLDGHIYGFFGGLWHGIIAPISFIGSLFSDSIAVWAVNNTGSSYTFGFLLGCGGLGFISKWRFIIKFKNS